MKRLILMRHAQAGFDAAIDGQRSLTDIGKEQALQAGQIIAQKKWKPDLILCSPLLRARQSAQLVSQEIGCHVQTAVELDGRLSAVGLVSFAMKQLEKMDCVLLVGHNPNVSLAAAVLSQRYVSFGPGDLAAFDVTDPKNPRLLLEKA